MKNETTKLPRDHHQHDYDEHRHHITTATTTTTPTTTTTTTAAYSYCYDHSATASTISAATTAGDNDLVLHDYRLQRIASVVTIKLESLMVSGVKIVTAKVLIEAEPRTCRRSWRTARSSSARCHNPTFPVSCHLNASPKPPSDTSSILRRC